MLGGMESSGRAGGKKDEYVTMASVDNPLFQKPHDEKTAPVYDEKTALVQKTSDLDVGSFRSGYTRTELAIDALSFMTAEVQHMGALTAIFCHSEEKGLGLDLTTTGIVMAVQYIVAVASGPFCGHLLDNTRRKRLVVGLTLLATASTYLMLSFVETFWQVLCVLIIQSACSGMYIPCVNSFSLGFSGKMGFPKRCTRNEMFRHGGVLLASILPIMIIPHYSFHTYFYVLCCIAVGATVPAILIDDSKINHAVARGQEDDSTPGSIAPTAVPYSTLFKRMPILLLVASVTIFHLGNAAMLPMVGQKIDELEHANNTHIEVPIIGEIDGTVGVSVASVISEVVSIPTSFMAGKFANTPGWGRRRIALIGFMALPIRGVLLGMTESIPPLFAIQVLDGLGASIVGVVPIMMMQDLTDGTGRFSSMQGIICASLGFGTAMSQVLAGAVADAYGYEAMFFTLSSIALVALLCVIIMPESKPSLLRPLLG